MLFTVLKLKSDWLRSEGVVGWYKTVAERRDKVHGD